MFYTFDQNNSGGVFREDRLAGISVYVIVEADSEAEAIEKALYIGIYFDDTYDIDCECCGQRWSRWITGYEQPLIYGQLADGSWQPRYHKWAEGPEAYIHYKDGTVKPVGL